MPIPDPNFVASVPLQYIFLDKDTGGPLSSGIVSFFSDPDFSIPKDVYQLTLNPDNTITFAPVSSSPSSKGVLILSGFGTFVDPTGNNLVPYYFPYDGTPGDTDPGNLQLYFVTVQSSTGVLQFTLQEWPPNCLSDSGGNTNTSEQTQSILTNPQFTDVSFFADPITGVANIVVTGTNTQTPIAPGWTLVTSGSGNIILSQISINSDIPSETSTALEIQSTGGVSDVQLVQRLASAPRILSNPTTIEATSYISGSLVARSAISSSPIISMSYVTYNSGVVNTTTQIFSKTTLATHQFSTLNGTAAIETPLSTDGSLGYVDIIIDIAPLTTVDISSVQVLGVNSATTTPGYIQSSPQQQESDLMWYYKPQLAYKPIPSYLVGWDFAFNPCQALGPTVGATTLGGANLSRYIADQTIMFTSVDNSITAVFSPAFTSGGVNFSNVTTSSFALVQYLSGPNVIELLQNSLSVQLQGFSTLTNIPCEINLYWTQDGSLPNIQASTYQSLVSGVTSTGVQSVANGTWNKIPRINSTGGVRFNLTPISSTTPSLHDFNGWNASQVAGITSATFFAIVVSFGNMVNPNQIVLKYISLCAGDIATRPAAESVSQTLLDCQYYYQKSFIPGVIPAQNVGLNMGETIFVQTSIAGSGTGVLPITFPTPMRAAPIVTVYNPAATNAQIRNITIGADYSSTTSGQVSGTFNNNGFYITGTAPALSSVGNTIGINWTADGRLGVV